MKTIEDQVLTLDDWAEYLKIKKSTLRLAQQGRLPGRKVGRHWRFHRAVIDAWLRRETPAASDGTR